MEKVRKFKLMYGLVSLGYLVLGLVLLFYPAFSMATLCYVFGILTLVYGVFHIVVYFMKDGTTSIFRFDLVIGLIAVAASIWMLARPAGILKLIPIILGAFVLLSALMKLQYSIDLRKMDYERWWLVLIFALVCGALGVLLLFRPFAAAKTMTMLLGGVLALDGIAGIWTMVCISMQFHRLKKAAYEVVDAIEDMGKPVAETIEPENIVSAPEEEDGVPVDIDIEPLPEEYFKKD